MGATLGTVASLEPLQKAWEFFLIFLWLFEFLRIEARIFPVLFHVLCLFIELALVFHIVHYHLPLEPVLVLHILFWSFFPCHLFFSCCKLGVFFNFPSICWKFDVSWRSVLYYFTYCC